MASSSIRETKGFEIQTSDICRPPKGASFICQLLQYIAESFGISAEGIKYYDTKIGKKAVTRLYGITIFLSHLHFITPERNVYSFYPITTSLEQLSYL